MMVLTVALKDFSEGMLDVFSVLTLLEIVPLELTKTNLIQCQVW